MLAINSKNLDFKDVQPGAVCCENGCCFSVWAPNASKIIIHLYDKSEREIKTFALPEKKGGTWYGFCEGVKAKDMYSIEALGEYDPSRGLFFKQGHVLVDPYAKAISKPFVYTEDRYNNHYDEFIPKSIVWDDSEFDWQNIHKPNLSIDDLIIYECNVKGLTMLNELVPQQLRGKYLGVCDQNVINHLKRLGITAVQLNPIYAFISEPHLSRLKLVNYWGYNPMCYFAPDPRYAVSSRDAVTEFKTMVRELHRNGIAVILDVVYNHTGEGGGNGLVMSLKGLDAHDYYIHPKNSDGSENYGEYYDVTGCGNSVKVDSMPSLKLVISSMLHWLDDMQVDGFRFDLCATLCRESHGPIFNEFDPNCAFLKSCFCNESISKAFLIAEPWDIGNGGYRVGQFPDGWSEQNDKFRDTVRKFWRGDSGFIGEYVTRVMGSRDIYPPSVRSIKSSVNFVTYHDGFTLEDLVSYNEKHNEANGEDNRDGCNDNYSCNCGVEGPTKNKKIREKRWQLKRNLITTTLLGQGIPHFLGGDEFSRTQMGNNNCYCQDNEMSWINWDYSEENRNFITFISLLNQLRHESMMLREMVLENEQFYVTSKKYGARWYNEKGLEMHSSSWNDPNCKSVALFVGSLVDDSGENLCVAFTQEEKGTLFDLPYVDEDKEWVEVFDSSSPTGLPKKGNEGVSRIKFFCPCIKIFKLRNSSNIFDNDNASIESLTRHSNRN